MEWNGMTLEVSEKIYLLITYIHIDMYMYIIHVNHSTWGCKLTHKQRHSWRIQLELDLSFPERSSFLERIEPMPPRLAPWQHTHSCACTHLLSSHSLFACKFSESLCSCNSWVLLLLLLLLHTLAQSIVALCSLLWILPLKLFMWCLFLALEDVTRKTCSCPLSLAPSTQSSERTMHLFSSHSVDSIDHVNCITIFIMRWL